MSMKKFRILTRKIRRYHDRDIIVVETSLGKQPFYRRTGRGGTNDNGAHAGMWAPYHGHMAHRWMVKSAEASIEGDLHRYGTEENKQVGEWLDAQTIGEGEETSWKRINMVFHKMGIVGNCLLYKKGGTTCPKGGAMYCYFDYTLKKEDWLTYID